MGTWTAHVFRPRTWWQRFRGSAPCRLLSASVQHLDPHEARLQSGRLRLGSRVVVVLTHQQMGHRLKVRGRIMKGEPPVIRWDELSWDQVLVIESVRRGLCQGVSQG
ncbi:MAG: hypothetical protein HYY16_13440 [Planctomycetes bacterium]|nr:hypothetical protein [Planctomycetota bacterium]